MHFGKRLFDARDLLGGVCIPGQANRSVIACTKTTMISRIIANSARAIISPSARVAFCLDGLTRRPMPGDAPRRGLRFAINALTYFRLCSKGDNRASGESEEPQLKASGKALAPAEPRPRIDLRRSRATSLTMPQATSARIFGELGLSGLTRQSVLWEEIKLRHHGDVLFGHCCRRAQPIGPRSGHEAADSLMPANPPRQHLRYDPSLRSLAQRNNARSQLVPLAP